MHSDVHLIEVTLDHVVKTEPGNPAYARLSDSDAYAVLLCGSMPESRDTWVTNLGGRRPPVHKGVESKKQGPCIAGSRKSGGFLPDLEFLDLFNCHLPGISAASPDDFWYSWLGLRPGVGLEGDENPCTLQNSDVPGNPKGRPPLEFKCEALSWSSGSEIVIIR
ncbi:hypothetical protein Ancab_023431 [Ancistrocladus abbreviatus]